MPELPELACFFYTVAIAATLCGLCEYGLGRHYAHRIDDDTKRILRDVCPRLNHDGETVSAPHCSVAWQTDGARRVLVLKNPPRAGCKYANPFAAGHHCTSLTRQWVYDRHRI